MKNTFKELVQRKVVKWPSERGFDKTKWDDLWEKNRSENPLDIGLYEAGHVFDRVFTAIRAEVSNLYRQCPSFTRDKLLQIYFGVANRNRHLVSSTDVAQEGQGSASIHSFTTSNTSLGNKITLQEVADNSVDGIQKAISSLIKMPGEIKVSTAPLDPMQFVHLEHAFSNLYDVYESYWMALIWGDYQFRLLNDEGEGIEITQQRSGFEESKCLSLNRKLRLHGQESMMIMKAGLHLLPCDDLYIDVEGGGKRRSLTVQGIDGASEWQRLHNVFFQIEIDEIGDWFSTGLMKAVQDKVGVSIMELLSIFKALSLLAHSFSNRFPKNSGIVNPKQLYEYCPKLKISELISTISLTTKIERTKCERALDYLSFTGEGKRDLWCHPLVKIKGQQVLLLTSALVTPMVRRLVENWLNDLGIDMSVKGTAYEKLVFQEVSDAISENELFRDCRIEFSKRFFASDGSNEEIDIVIKIGSLIVIGESKSIVTTDSPISGYRAKQTLSGAAVQAKRKTTFFQNNTGLFLDQLKWDYSDINDFRFCPIIVDGGKSLVGANIDDVPVCDEHILKKFFETGKFPLISRDADTHIAWFEIYTDFKEAENVFPQYIANPPQMARPIHGTKYIVDRLPPYNTSFPSSIFKRLAPADINAAEIPGMKTFFPIFTAENFDAEIKKLEVLM